MKITLNLSPAPSWRDRYALVWAIPVTVLGIATLVILFRASTSEYRQYRMVEQQLGEVETRVETLRDQEGKLRAQLDNPSSRETLREAKFVNALINRRKLSLAGLTARVTGLLPDQAHLIALQLAPPKTPQDDPMVRIGITTNGEDAIETFINDLEDSADFKDVSILNQGFQEETSQGEQITIVCTARYVPGAEEEFEAEAAREDEAKKGGEAEKKLAAKEKKTEAGAQAAEAKHAKPQAARVKPVAGAPAKLGAAPAGHPPGASPTPAARPRVPGHPPSGPLPPGGQGPAPGPPSGVGAPGAPRPPSQ